MHKCPIKGCKFTFAQGRLGWDAHVGSLKNHPDYHPRIKNLDDRLMTFAIDHPEFFEEKHAPRSGTYGKVELPAKVRKSA